MSSKKLTPKKGERWVLGNLPETLVTGDLHPYYEIWSELNGEVVDILEVHHDGLSATFRIVDFPDREAEVWGKFFVKRVETQQTKKYTCCQPGLRPSQTLCNECRAEFQQEMMAKGKTYSKWDKLWK